MTVNSGTSTSNYHTDENSAAGEERSMMQVPGYWLQPLIGVIGWITWLQSQCSMQAATAEG